MKLKNLLTLLLMLAVLGATSIGLWRLTSARAAESLPKFTAKSLRETGSSC